MWLVRPATPDDLQQILEIAAAAAQLSSTLPRQEEALVRLLEHSQRSFAGQHDPAAPPRFLFVLEDSESGRLHGTAGIDSHAGNGQPFYSYRRDALIHASHELGISRRVEVLYPSHGLTGRTLLCAFVIRRELVGTDAFELLSRARLLFVAEHRDWFARDMVVEIQGVQHEDGRVPFWDSLGRHFFDMDFRTADEYSSRLSKTFIAELMPPNPIYVTLLSTEAQAALGQAHSQKAPNLALLQREGFRTGDYIDIFDAGPVLEARTDQLRTLVTSQRRVLHASCEQEGEMCLLAAGEGAGFRCTLAPATETLTDALRVPVSVWHLLNRSAGDPVRTVPL